MNERSSRPSDFPLKRQPTNPLGPIIVLILALFLAACAAPTPSAVPPGELFKETDALPGWTVFEQAVTYTRDDLYNLVDGQADAFFVYGFEQVTVKRYQNTDGAVVSVEVWQADRPENAYGIFSSARSGVAAEMGNEGDLDPGRRLVFWQNRYYVHVNANQKIADQDLVSFAQAAAQVLPQGGQRPAIVDRLPGDGLVQGEFFYFHDELSIQSRVWLGGTNLLGLGPQTDGAIGQYELGGQAAYLLLVQFSSSSQAQAALQALQGGEIEEVAAAKAAGSLLGAVFGPVDPQAASSLLDQGLEP